MHTTGHASLDPRYNSPEDWIAEGLPLCQPPKGDWTPCYLRFGKPPPGGRSFDYVRQTYEVGVSVFRGYITSAGEYLVDLDNRVSVSSDYLGVRNRAAYVVCGYPVGVGSCGDTLVVVEGFEPVPRGVTVRPTIELPKWFVRRLEDAHKKRKQRLKYFWTMSHPVKFMGV